MYNRITFPCRTLDVCRTLGVARSGPDLAQGLRHGQGNHSGLRLLQKVPMAISIEDFEDRASANALVM